LFVADSRPASGRVVLFLHALGLDHSMWSPHRASLQAGLRILAVDLPGFGRSRLESSLAQRVEACATEISRAGLTAIVVGVSYGGLMAATLAASYPELVSNLVISGVRARYPSLLVALQVATFQLMPVGKLKRGECVSRDDLKIERRHLVEASRELVRVDLTPVLRRIVARSIVFAPSHDCCPWARSPLDRA
jgi:pimeloyl-ACP methyl ester carboxylesterase